VRQPLAEMGRLGVSLLTRLLENRRLEALHVELATQLIIRESTAPPRAESPGIRAARRSRRRSPA
jgi:LacI family transcriptional regulator